MKTYRNRPWTVLVTLTSLATLALLFGGWLLSPHQATAQDKKPGGNSEFARNVVDIGTVVSDVEKAVKFYTEAVGFVEVTGFSVPGDFCRDSGLTDGKGLKIRVLVLGKGENATRLKLMEVPGVQSRPSDNAFVHSQLGFSYITVFVNDTTAALQRLKRAGVKPLAKGPVALPKSLAQGVFLTVVKDPDGNLVELVGPGA